MDEQYVPRTVIRQYRSSSPHSEQGTVAASHLGIGALCYPCTFVGGLAQLIVKLVRAQVQEEAHAHG
jgi:hypothetical protein